MTRRTGSLTSLRPSRTAALASGLVLVAGAMTVGASSASAAPELTTCKAGTATTPC
jgi:hypothetical protein